MVTEQQGEAACYDIERWANRITKQSDEDTAVQVFYDADSNTYILRLAKQARVLVFRLSVAQVRGPGREIECERTLRRKLKDLRHLI
jgi:hypothetical protein